MEWHFGRHHDFWFQFGLGDKDTFRFAWKATDTPYVYPQQYLSSAGVLMQPEGDFCGHTMVQYDFSDQVMFLHANLAKDGYAAFAERHGALWQLVQRYNHSNVMRAGSPFRPQVVGVHGQVCVQLQRDERRLPETDVQLVPLQSLIDIDRVEELFLGITLQESNRWAAFMQQQQK